MCQLTQEQLSKVLFPIGDLKKEKVREIAKAQKLVTAGKKDSQGLCFIGKVSLPDFLQQQLQPKKGSIIEIPSDFRIYQDLKTKEQTLQEQSTALQYLPEDGIAVGEHAGAHYFTIGQRKGLRVGGMESPLFVIATDVETNTLYVGQGKNHPGLYRETLKVPTDEVHWIREDLRLNNGEHLAVKARIRYRQPLQNAELYQTKKGCMCFSKRLNQPLHQDSLWPGIRKLNYWLWGDKLVFKLLQSLVYTLTGRRQTLFSYT